MTKVMKVRNMLMTVKLLLLGGAGEEPEIVKKRKYISNAGMLLLARMD